MTTIPLADINRKPDDMETWELVPQQAMLARMCFPASILSPATGRRATWPAAPM
jgi:hypothetical protein